MLFFRSGCIEVNTRARRRRKGEEDTCDIGTGNKRDEHRHSSAGGTANKDVGDQARAGGVRGGDGATAAGKDRGGEETGAGGTIKRRNTAKKLDGRDGGDRTSKTSLGGGGAGGRDKDVRASGGLGGGGGGVSGGRDAGDGRTGESSLPQEKSDSEEDDKLDDKNVVFCMWGHENCRTRSHYRYPFTN